MCPNTQASDLCQSQVKLKLQPKQEVDSWGAEYLSAALHLHPNDAVLPRSHLQETWCDFTISHTSPVYSCACADFYLQSLSSLITVAAISNRIPHTDWQKRSIMILSPHKSVIPHEKHLTENTNSIEWLELMGYFEGILALIWNLVQMHGKWNQHGNIANEA